MKIFTRFTLSLLFLTGTFFSLHSNAQTTSETTTVTTQQEDGGPRLSRGGVFLEPFISYETATTQMRTSQLPVVSDDTSGTNQGFGVGGRIGGHIWEALWLAGDVRYARTQLQDSFYQNAEADNFNYGATLGVQTPWAGIRLWGTYVIDGFSDPAAGVGGLNVKFDDMRGYRIGAGVHLAAVSVNLEYHDTEFGSTSVSGGVGPVRATANTSIDADSRGYTLSLGFPLEL